MTSLFAVKRRVVPRRGLGWPQGWELCPSNCIKGYFAFLVESGKLSERGL